MKLSASPGKIRWTLPLLAKICSCAILCVCLGCSHGEPSIENHTRDAEAGNEEAQYRLGKMYLFGENVPANTAQAYKWLLKAATHGYPPGSYLLGTMYLEGGQRIVPKDQKEAFKHFQRSAEKGFATAQNKMGEHYLHGWGVPKDLVLAREWFEKAAKQGLADGQYNLGQRYFKAEGVVQSDETATKWLSRAAHQGHSLAQFLLAQRYAEGGAGTIDYIEAYKWATIAHQPTILQSVTKKMNAEQIKDARARVEKFQPILELDPLEPPEPKAIYWLWGICIATFYAAAFCFFLYTRKKKPALEAKATTVAT